MANYSVGGGGGFGYMPSNTNYGAVVEGNERNSYGPWVDPELQRRPHRRRSAINNRRGRRRRRHNYPYIGS